MIKLALFTILIAALTTATIRYMVDDKSFFDDFISIFGVYGGVMILAYIVSVPLRILKIFGSDIIYVIFGFIATLLQLICIFSVLISIIKKNVKVELEEVGGVPALVKRGFYNTEHYMVMNNLSLIAVVLAIIESSNTNIYFRSIYQQMDRSLSFKIVVPLYLITCLVLFKRARDEKYLLGKLKTDNDYLYSEVSSLYPSWKRDFVKKVNHYNLAHRVIEFNTNSTDNPISLTNTDMYKESSNMLRFLERLKGLQSGDNANLAKQLSLYLDIDNYNYNSMRAFSENIYKGFKAEEVMMDKIGHLGGLVDNITLESNGHKVELDAIIINDDGVYLIEVKNYSADVIRFEASGMVYRDTNDRSERMDILGQVSRARDIIRDIIGPNINIYNVIVFADHTTRVEDHMKHENVRAVHMDYLSFIFQNKTNNNPDNEDIKKRLLKAKIKEREYDFYDVLEVKSNFTQAIDEDIRTLNKVIKYSQDFNLVETEIKQIKSDVEKKIGGHKFRKADRQMILGLYEGKLNAYRDHLRSYFQRLDQVQINSMIMELEGLKGMLGGKRRSGGNRKRN